MSNYNSRLTSAQICSNEFFLVKCPCKVNKDHGLMILCDDCGFWQHGACFAVIDECYVPTKHYCNSCAVPPSKCTDPRICLDNSNLVQATCLYRRALVLLNGFKGLVTPAKITYWLYVELSVAVRIIDKLLSDKILKRRRSLSSCTIDKRQLLKFAYPKYLNKIVWQSPTRTDVSIPSDLQNYNAPSNDMSVDADIEEINEEFPKCGSEDKNENNASVIKLRTDSDSPPQIQNVKDKQNFGDENELCVTKMADIGLDQASLKKLNRKNIKKKKIILRRPALVERRNKQLLPAEGLKGFRTLKCSFCNKMFKRTYLRKHIKKIHAKNYKCSQCAFSTDDRKKLEQHCVSHTTLECSYCSKTFGNKYKLNRHISCVHKKLDTFKCSYCDFSCSAKVNLTTHISSAHEKLRPFKCSLCNYTSNKKENLQNHIVSHNKEKSFQCSFCLQKFKRLYNLQVHVKNIHADIYKCSQCEYSTDDKRKVKEHGLSHVTLKCSLCAKTFGNRWKLNEHISCVHEKRKTFKCGDCDFVSSAKVNLKSHIREIHGDLRPYKCSLCDYAAKRRGHLQSHVLSVHKKLKSFKCSQCDFSATRRQHLGSHILSIHESEIEKPFKCTYCSKSFAKKWQLSDHTSIVHEKLKQFQCEDCSFVSGYKSHLLYHIQRIHLSRKAHKCSKCRYSSDDKEDLTSHVSAVHEKINYFGCEHCDYASNYKWNLECHIRTIHEKLRPFKCVECVYTFSTKATLNSHLRAFHLKKFECSKCEFTCQGERELFVHNSTVHEKVDPFQCEDCGYISNYKWNLVCHMRCAHSK